MQSAIAWERTLTLGAITIDAIISGLMACVRSVREANIVRVRLLEIRDEIF